MKPERARRINICDYVIKVFLQPAKGVTTRKKWRVAFYQDGFYCKHDYYKDRKSAYAAAAEWDNEYEGMTTQVEKITRYIAW